MITARFMGRLGNQMFEYAMARAQAKRLGVELGLDTTLYRVDHPFQLKQWAGVTERIVERSAPTVYEQGMPYNPAVESIKDGAVLQGYWQSYKYFSNIWPDLRQVFIPKEFNPDAREKVIAIANVQTSVAVHVRRGDYLKSPHKEFHGVLSLTYYNTAMTMIREKVNCPTFFIFAEDTEWTKENFQAPDQIVMEPGREAEDIWLMSLCKHHIIANSSYSWWGAWLAEPEGQVVIAPKNWYASGQEDTRDLLPERWITI